MKPSEVRDVIAREHMQIRIRLADLDAECRRALDGERVDVRPRALDLVRLLWDHLALEDRILIPTLREIDAWGAIRAENASTEHCRQRRELSALAHLARRGTSHAVADLARRLVHDLRVDMDREEQDLLSADVLRDDVIAIDQADG